MVRRLEGFDEQSNLLVLKVNTSIRYPIGSDTESAELTGKNFLRRLTLLVLANVTAGVVF